MKTKPTRSKRPKPAAKPATPPDEHAEATIAEKLILILVAAALGAFLLWWIFNVLRSRLSK